MSLIVGGEPHASDRPGHAAEECFPEALRHRVGSDGAILPARAEPLAADARPEKDGREGALLKVVAGLLGVGFDQLRQRDLEQRNARLRRVAAVSAVLVAGFAGLATYALVQQRRAEERSRVAQSRQLAAQSRNLLGTSPDLPLLLALEALYAKPTVEARRSLFEALTVQRRPISLLRAGAATNWNSLALTRDGRTLVGGGKNGELAFWNLADADAEPQRVPSGFAQVGALALSRDGATLAVAGSDGRIVFWDPRTRERRADLQVPAQDGAVGALAFGTDGQFASGILAADGLHAQISLWHLGEGQPRRVFEQDAMGSVTSIAFSADGGLLAAAALGGDTVLWNTADGQPLQSDFLKDTGTLAISPDGRWLASGSWELSLRRITDFQRTAIALPDAPTHVSAVAFNPDGQRLAAATARGNVAVWDVATRKLAEGPFPLGIGSLDDLRWSPDGQSLLVSGEGGRVAVIPLREAPLRQDLAVDGDLQDFAFDTATGHLATLSGSGTLGLWDAAAQPLSRARIGPANGAAMALLDGGRQVATGDLQGRLAIWSVAPGQPPLQPTPVAPAAIDSLVLSPDGRTLAAVPRGPQVILWDLERKGPAVAPLKADAAFARSAAFSAKGDRLFTVGDGGEIMTWDPHTGLAVGAGVKLGGGADALALSPDDAILAAGAYDGRLVLLDRATGRPIGVPLSGHTNIVRAEVFSPDGLTLASGGDDGTVLLWDVPSRQIVARFSHGATVLSGDGSARTPLSVTRLHFSPDGRHLAADGPARRVVLWDVALSSWMAQACSAARRDLDQDEWRRYLGEQDAYRPTCPGGKPRS